MRIFVSASLMAIALSSMVLGAACSKGDEVESEETSGGDGGAKGTDSSTGTSVPIPEGGTPVGDSSTTTQPTSDGGIQGPTFDITKIATLSGTFVTDKTAVNEVQSNATVTWSFKIDNIVDATQQSTTAKWSVHATNVVGGNASDFPDDTNIDLMVSRTSSDTDPRTGSWEFYGNQLSPYVYVLVKVEAGKVVDFYYYRRLLDDSETNPADKPHNVTYTTTNK